MNYIFFMFIIYRVMFIINPLDKQKYAINSRNGINVIKKYINYFRLNQSGGATTKTDTTTTV